MKEKIFIDTEFIRLDSALKLAGTVESGGQAKYFIQNGEVSVGGETCTMRGKKLYDGDWFSIGGNEFEVSKK